MADDKTEDSGLPITASPHLNNQGGIQATTVGGNVTVTNAGHGINATVSGDRNAIVTTTGTVSGAPERGIHSITTGGNITVSQSGSVSGHGIAHINTGGNVLANDYASFGGPILIGPPRPLVGLLEAARAKPLADFEPIVVTKDSNPALVESGQTIEKVTPPAEVFLNTDTTHAGKDVIYDESGFGSGAGAGPLIGNQHTAVRF